MASSLRNLGSLAMAALLLTAESCVSYSDGGGPKDAGGSSTDGSVLPDGGACPGSTTLCGSVCADLQGSGENCGACGHSCGGGSCKGGSCEAVLVRDSLGTGAIRYTVDDKLVYFTSGARILSVPIAGNVVVATQHADLGSLPPTVLAAARGTLFFGGEVDRTVQSSSGTVVRRFSDLYACDSSATCPDNLPDLFEVLGSRPISTIATSAGNVYFSPSGMGARYATCTGPGACAQSNGLFGSSASFMVADDVNLYAVVAGGGGTTQLLRCPATAAECKTPFVLNAAIPDAANLVGIAVREDKVYLAYGGNTGAKDARILRCPAAGCTAGPEPFAKDLGPLTTIAADATGVYFNDMDAGRILRCAGADCAKGPDLLSQRDGTPGDFVLRSQLFFIEKSVQSGTRILRIAK
jgi:hypothetical protein